MFWNGWATIVLDFIWNFKIVIQEIFERSKVWLNSAMSRRYVRWLTVNVGFYDTVYDTANALSGSNLQCGKDVHTSGEPR